MEYKVRLKEIMIKRASLMEMIEDHNIEILSLTGQIRYLDYEIEILIKKLNTNIPRKKIKNPL